MLMGHGSRWLLEQWRGGIARTFKPGKYRAQRLNHMRKPILREKLWCIIRVLSVRFICT